MSINIVHVNNSSESSTIFKSVKVSGDQKVLRTATLEQSKIKTEKPLVGKKLFK